MNRQVPCFCLLALLAVPLSAQKHPAGPLRSQMEAEFAGKEFQTKIVFGSFFSNRAQSGKTVTQAVDTELSPKSDEIQYYARAGCCPLVAGFHIKPDSITMRLPVGSRVLVKKIEFMGDRVELQLAGTRAGEYAKLKVVLWKGYEQQMDFPAVQKVISRALRIERLEQQQALESEFEALKERMSAAEADVRRFATEPDKRLPAMDNLRRTLEQLKQNRSAYAALTGQSPDASQYTAQAEELGRAIPALKESIKKQRIAAIRSQLNAQEQQASALKASLRARPASLKDWQGQADSLKRWEESLGQRRNLHSQLVAEGEPPSPPEVAALDKDLQESGDARKTLEGMRQELQLLQLDNEYKDMERKRMQLLDSFTRAFGTPKQKSEAARLLDHLQLMHKNRTAAVELGSKDAAAQLARLLKELERIKRQQ
jgi:hypothetical protein